MGEQLGKMLAAAQPEPPSIERSISVLKQQKEPAAEACDSSMVPKPVGRSLPESKSKGPTKVEKGGGGLALEFEEVRTKHEVEYKSFDE